MHTRLGMIIIALLLAAGCAQRSVDHTDAPTIDPVAERAYRAIELPSFNAYLRAIDTPQAADAESLELARESWSHEVIATARSNDGGDITTRESAFIVLSVTQALNGTAIGYAGSVSAEVQAWRVLRDQPDAASAFRVLFDRAGVAGQFYALVGLERTDKPTFERLARDYFKRRDTIAALIYGCVGTSYRVDELEPSVRDGTFGRLFETGDVELVDKITPPTAYMESLGEIRPLFDADAP